MAKYTCPPQTASGFGTFSDNLVGLQLVNGGGLTQGNFEYTTSTSEKVNRNFTTGTFSNPINLDSLGVSDVNQSRLIIEKNFKVYPNYDLSQITNFVQYGSMVKRMSAAVTKIISYFPAAIESNKLGINYTSDVTAFNISYSEINDETTFSLDLTRIRNPFNIDFTTNATRNLQLREIEVSPLRNLTTGFTSYSLYINDEGYGITGIVPTSSLSSGTLILYTEGNPFSGQSFTYDDLIIRPNDYEVNKVFNENLDQVENFLLNRNVKPKYTANFSVPTENEDGTFSIGNVLLTWPLYGFWNLDIVSQGFKNYLVTLNDVSENFDSYQSNLVSRFLTTGAFKEFDTVGQKAEKVLQLYGRSFDEVKKYINALAFMTSVNYNVGNDIPSQLLKNLALTLGWSTNISPITNDDFLASVFGQKNQGKPNYTGTAAVQTPDELNYQYYRNLILNSAYLFKSKGTRKSVEILLKLIGAPDALVEFNEYIYLADQRINLSEFDTQYAQISGGTYVEQIPILDTAEVRTIMNITYTGFTTIARIKDVNVTLDDFPMDEFGYPQAPIDNESYYFQIGSGWFEQTPQHRAPEEVDPTLSVFFGNNPNFQTSLIPYTYGQVYLDRFRDFPFMTLGYRLTPQIDNNKSWFAEEVNLRSNLDGNFNARYFTESDKLVLNVKNVDLFLNPAQGLVYDVWSMSRQLNYPIPNEGLNYIRPTYCNPNPNSIYPDRGGVDWTIINPQPKRKTFFEFAQTFWKNMINVRNRQYANNGKTGGYPTLESIYWKYIQSESIANLPNNNFTYDNMIQYVNGMGDYWVRLVEQMIPATTIWNTGVKMENSIFHRQKFGWRRQRGCQLIPANQGGGIAPGGGETFLGRVPPLCRPCQSYTNIFNYDCPIQSITCPKYPWLENPEVLSLEGVLGNLLSTYLTSNGYELNDCILDGLVTEWYINIQVSGNTLVNYSFFNGYTYSFNPYNAPNVSQYDTALTNALDSLIYFGYDYYLTDDNNIVVFNQICQENDSGLDFKISIGINFEIFCS